MASRSSGLAKTTLQGTMKEQKKRWKDNIKKKSGQEWTFPAQLGQLKQDKVERDCCKFICGTPDDLPKLWDK